MGHRYKSWHWNSLAFPACCASWKRVKLFSHYYFSNFSHHCFFDFISFYNLLNLNKKIPENVKKCHIWIFSLFPSVFLIHSIEGKQKKWNYALKFSTLDAQKSTFEYGQLWVKKFRLRSSTFKEKNESDYWLHLFKMGFLVDFQTLRGMIFLWL